MKKIIYFIITLSILVTVFILLSTTSIQEIYHKKSPDNQWEIIVTTSYNSENKKYHIVYEILKNEIRDFYLEYPSEFFVSARESNLTWSKDSKMITSIIPCFNTSVEQKIFFELDVINHSQYLKIVRD